MLTLLRKLRRSFIESGSARKYILYAVGEIALVVIGILIALQINNWNEGKKTRKHVDLYLYNLSEALKEDIHKHKSAASMNEFRYNAFQYLLKITGNEQLGGRPLAKDGYPNDRIWPGAYPDTFNREFIDVSLSLSVFLQAQNTNQTVYEEMKSTGLFSQIKNQELKKTISDYYNFCDTYLRDNGDWNLRVSTSWQSFLRDQYDFIIAGEQTFGDPLELISDPKVITRIQELVAPAKFRAENSYAAVKLAENIITEIDKQRIQSNK